MGGTPSPSHNSSTGPMSFPGNPSDWSWVPSEGEGVLVPGGGGTQVPDGVPQPMWGWG